ncbi:Crp/Fnr family transcriptional regulator [Bradyrhizobium liaoningense]
MNSNADLSTILDRIVDTAADNLRIANILAQMGLDPNNITYEALINRLIEIVLANITLANMFALVGAIFFVATLLMQRMVPLRVANMVGCTFFVISCALSGSIATFLLYLLLLPVNAVRLRQLLKLVRKARNATQGDRSMEWLKPFMTERRYRRGDILFRKGDAAAEMFLTVTGKFLVKEIGVELPPGRLMGELGFLTPSNRRTATVECIEDGHVLTITYERLLEIYFQNDQQFGYYILVLTSQHLLENNHRLQESIWRLEAALGQEQAARQTAGAPGTA